MSLHHSVHPDPATSTGFRFRIASSTIAALASMLMAACNEPEPASPPPTADSAPSFIGQPRSQIVDEGHSVAFTVSVAGNPAPALQWQYSVDGGRIWQPYTGAGATTSTISDDGRQVHAALDGSQFRAVATNRLGTATSMPATLSVRAPVPNAITGQITAAPGGDVHGTFMVACLLVGTTCDETRSVVAQIIDNGSSARYAINGLTPGDYLVVALQATLDANGEIANVSASGIYMAGGTTNANGYTVVHPSTGGVDIVLASTTSPGTNAPPPNSAADPIPAGFPGTYFLGSALPRDFYDPSTGRWTSQLRSGGGVTYEFRPDGTVVKSNFITSAFFNEQYFTYLVGRYRISGDQLILTDLRGQYQKTKGTSVITNQPAGPYSETHTWRVGNDAYGVYSLFLRGANQSNESQYARQGGRP